MSAVGTAMAFATWQVVQCKQLKIKMMSALVSPRFREHQTRKCPKAMAKQRDEKCRLGGLNCQVFCSSCHLPCSLGAREANSQMRRRRLEQATAGTCKTSAEGLWLHGYHSLRQLEEGDAARSAFTRLHS